jgi:hypothetical protein
MADGIVYTHEEFIGLLMDTMDRQLTVRNRHTLIFVGTNTLLLLWPNGICCRISQRLYDLGARNVWFSGLAPLGCIPSQRVLSDNGGCLDDVNAYAVQFNAAARNLLERLNAKLPGASMSLADCYSVVMELIEHPQKYGFKTSHTSCCDVDTTVGGLCLPTAQLCDDRTAFVFWDAYHTSDAANQVIADRLYADMVSAGAVQGNGNATAAAAASTPAPRVVVGGGASPSTHAAPPPKP